MKVLLTGLPGSGKTTIARMISEKYQLCMVKTGELLREMAKGGDEIAKQIQRNMATGEYTDDNLVAEVVKKALAEKECANGFVMDGYPRSLEQLGVFDPNFDLVIDLDIKDELVVERLLKRGREDDTPELIRKRLDWYHNLTEPVLNHYESQRILHKINGALDVDKVWAKVKEVIDGQGKK